MSIRFRGFALLLMFAAGVACSTNGSVGTARTRNDLITTEDLAGLNLNNLYDAVRSIRPNWLVARSPNSFQSPGRVQVYFDNVRIGGVENLRQISTQGVQAIQWFDPISASARWGLDHEQGAIVVTTSGGN